MNTIINVFIGEQDFDPKVTSQPHRFGTSWDFMQDQQRRAVNTMRSQEFVCIVLKLLVVLEYDVQATMSITDALLRQPNHYPVSTVLIPALEDLRSWLGDDKRNAIIPFVTCFISVMGSRNAPTPGDPKNLSQNVTVACNMGCNDCKTLQEFLRDSSKTQAHFRMNQVRRLHIEKQLTRLKCGTTHFTEHVGSPQTLVVNKVQQPQELKRPNQQDNSVRILSRLCTLCPPQASMAEPQPKRQKVNEGASLVAGGAVHT